MEHEMRLSTSEVRRLRIERGWSQEHLAQVAGRSLRTIQRVEAEGIASLSTATSLAATFSVPLLSLQPPPEPATPTTPAPEERHQPAPLLLGIAILTGAGLLLESSILQAPSTQGAFTAITAMLLLVGLSLIARPLIAAVRGAKYSALLMAGLGTPLMTFLVIGLMYSGLEQRLPLWQLLAIGACGGVFVILAWRSFRAPGRRVGV